jgi:predicted nuclease of predicted toxin-antitoxin system
VKALFDANLSHALVKALDVQFPNSAHVRHVGLRTATDDEIWDYAKVNGFTIVSKDTDFRERSFVKGAPPKVIWLDVGNAGTSDIIAVAQRERRRILDFEDRPDAALLILSLGASAV